MEGYFCPVVIVGVVFFYLLLAWSFKWGEKRDVQKSQKEFERRREEAENQKDLRPKTLDAFRNFFYVDSRIRIGVAYDHYEILSALKKARCGDYSAKPGEYLDLDNIAFEDFMEERLGINVMDIRMGEAAAASATLIGVVFAKVRSNKGVHIVGTFNDIRELIAGQYDKNLAAMTEFISTAVRRDTYLTS